MLKLVEADIPNIIPNTVFSKLVDGTWPLYFLIEHILNKIGPSKIYLSSYTFSEAAIRHLLFLKEEKKITHLTAIFDQGNRRTKTPLLFFAQETIDNLKLCPNHTKIYIFENHTQNLTILASANLSQNRRAETITIDTRQETFDQMKRDYLNLLATAQPL